MVHRFKCLFLSTISSIAQFIPFFKDEEEQGSVAGSDKAEEEEGEDLEDEEEYDEEEEEDDDRPRKKPRHGGFILDEAGSKNPLPTYISYIKVIYNIFGLFCIPEKYMYKDVSLFD